MRKAGFWVCTKNKGVDQLCGYHTADQGLCFCYIKSTIPLQIRNFFCGCKARFVLDMVGNPVARFSHDVTHMSSLSATFPKVPYQ